MATYAANGMGIAFDTTPRPPASTSSDRSEEHTSELQSLRHLVCRLLLEKKNKKYTLNQITRLSH